MSSQTTATASTQSSEAERRTIPQELYKIDKGQIAKRVEYVRQHNKMLAPEEIHLMLNPAEIEKSTDEVFFRGAHLCESMRNVTLLLPLAFTWFSLGLAVSAFAQNVNVGGGNKEFTLQSFLYLWAQGFPAITQAPLLFFKAPTVINFWFVHHWHYLSFGDLVIIDTLLILLIIALTVTYHILEQRGLKHVAILRIWMQQEVDELCERSSVRSLGPGPENKRPMWAVEVHTAIKELQSVLGKVESAVLTSGETFVKTVDRFTESYQQQNQTVSELTETVRNTDKAIDQLNLIYQQGKDTYKSLEAVLPRIETHFKLVAQYQEESNRTLQTVATEFSAASKAIDELARPFAAADLATIAQQTAQNMQYTTKQQQVVLQRLEQMETRLSQGIAPPTRAQKSRWSIASLFGIQSMKDSAQKKGK